MKGKYDPLRLENQLCFPLYVCAKEIVRRYKPHLDKLDLTYTQYITMMVLWDIKSVTVKELGDRLYLDSGTLTPVLKKLESKGYITRERSEKDERNLIVTITEDGKALKAKAACIPGKMSSCARLSPDEAKTLYDLLYKLLGNMDRTEEKS
ncbi:MAG: MarR family transcriptional regulator [Lachnospiraceae bacterium]|nr:MarR family transcriptional regulator [Lachnospiraceae bacterium]